MLSAGHLLFADLLFTLVVAFVLGGSGVVVDFLQSTLSNVKQLSANAVLVAMPLDTSLCLLNGLAGVVETVDRSVSQNLAAVSSTLGNPTTKRAEGQEKQQAETEGSERKRARGQEQGS